jgi:uncharacterized protein with ATP-grasp and redox domains
MGMSRKALSLNTSGRDADHDDVSLVTTEVFEEACAKEWTSAVAANKIYRKLKAFAQNPDPYDQVKSKEMKIAQELLSKFESHPSRDLNTCVRLSLLGNSLDFFKPPQEAFSEIIDQMEVGMTFFCDDTARFDAFLSTSPDLVLFLADNAGEIFFDLPLIDHVQERSRRFLLVVKGGPSLNDLTRYELEKAGLMKRFDGVIDTGTDGVGIDWDHVSPKFLGLVEEADLMVSKGMANFETIINRTCLPRVFFLFKVKCKPIGDYLEAVSGSYCALWEDAIR